MNKKLMTLVCAFIMIMALGSMSFAHGGRHGGYNKGNEFNQSYGHMYNSDLSEEELETLHEERMTTMKDTAAQYLEDGKITEEQYDAWLTRIEEMQAYHEENGFHSGGGRGFGHGLGGCRNYQSNDTL